MDALAGKRVGVYGLAKSGLGALRLLLREGAKPLGLDKAEEGKLGDLQGLKDQGVGFFVGSQFDPKKLREVDLIVVSPGVPLSLPELADARRRGVEVIGEIELAFRRLSFPLVGITGTN